MTSPRRPNEPMNTLGLRRSGRARRHSLAWMSAALLLGAGVGCGSISAVSKLTEQVTTKVVGHTLTTDSDALEAAKLGGHASSGLEVMLIGAGLLTEIPGKQLPISAIKTTSKVLSEVFSGCLTMTPVEGETVGLTLAFVEKGCGISGTNFLLKGGFTFSSAAEEDSSRWKLAFSQFEASSIKVDGSLDLDILKSTKLDYDIESLDVAYNEWSFFLDTRGDVTTNTLHTDIVFSGEGSMTMDGKSYSVTAQNLERHLSTDCYPEAGTLSVDFDGKKATLEFEDDNLGLDSDDTGLVRVMMGEDAHIAALPRRNCTAF